MNNLKCAIKIMEKNNYIKVTKNGNKFYYYWIIKSEVGNQILEKFKRYFDKDKEIVYIDTGRNNIKFTTTSEIKKGLETIFKKEKVTHYRGPIHMEVHKYLNSEECHKNIGYKISSDIYGNNDLGTLSEIIHLDKDKEKNEAEIKRKKEASELLDKLLL